MIGWWRKLEKRKTTFIGSVVSRPKSQLPEFNFENVFLLFFSGCAGWLKIGPSLLIVIHHSSLITHRPHNTHC